MQIFKNTMLLFLCLALFGCATSANYQQVVNRWQGVQVGTLIHLWGYPDGEVKLPNGNSVYMYTRQQLVTQPAPVTVAPFATTLGGTPYMGTGFTGGVIGQTTMIYCRTWFEVNHNGIIVNSQFQGNGCVSSRHGGLIP